MQLWVQARVLSFGCRQGVVALSTGRVSGRGVQLQLQARGAGSSAAASTVGAARRAPGPALLGQQGTGVYPYPDTLKLEALGPS